MIEILERFQQKSFIKNCLACLMPNIQISIPIHLGYKVRNLYKKEFNNLNKIIKNSLEKLEKKGIEFDEKTKTLTLIEEEDNVSISKLTDANTAYKSSKAIHFKTVKSKDIMANRDKSLSELSKKHQNQYNLFKGREKKQLAEGGLYLQIGGLFGELF